jgi:hypothetical protein
LANLQFATLSGADLWGASFERARLFGVDLSLSKLWRSVWDEQETSAHTLLAEGASWEPKVMTFRPTQGGQVLVSQGFVLWNDEAYAALKTEILSLPVGEHRTLALQRIAALDCHDHSLTPCNQVTPVPRVFENAVESTEDSFAKAVAAGMEKLVCNNTTKGPDGFHMPPSGESFETDAITILRGLVRSKSIRLARGEAPALVRRFQHPDCFVSKFLTDDDKTRLNEFAR